MAHFVEACWDRKRCNAVKTKMDAVVEKYLKLKKQELSSFLRARNVPVTNETHHELAEKAYYAEKLGLLPKPTDNEAELAIEKSKESKLHLDGGMIRLPRPESLQLGWEVSPQSLPATTRAHIDSYIKTAGRKVGLNNTEGVKTLGLGKGLYMSEHVRGMAYHGINANVSYCFVRGKVIPQTNTHNDPYFSWVVLNKDTGQIVTAECSCIVGIQAGCKHVTALLFAVVEAVEEGRNKSSTSKKMVWNAPPKKGETVHEAQFAEDFKVIQVRQDVSMQNLEASTRKCYRSNYDPRAFSHRVMHSVSSFDLDRLASITNGKTGLLMYNKLKPDLSRQIPDIEDVHHELETLTAVEALTVHEAFKACKSKTTDIVVQMKINKHQQLMLVNSTLQQGKCSKWFEYRQGRITSSVAGECAAAVTSKKEGGFQLKASHSSVARLMAYYGNSSSPALQWGKDREAIARKHYLAWHKLHNKHSRVFCEDTGLWISLENPYIAGSPDGVVHCKQCGHGLVEIKNPYTNRHLTISELVKEKESAGLICENSVVHLDRSHKYYTQIQVQLYTTGYNWCDFVVHTNSPSDNIHVERLLLNEQYLQELIPKLRFFFFNAIVPELKDEKVKEQVIQNIVKKTMDIILKKVEEATIPELSISGTLYPCGFCGDACEVDPTDPCLQSIGCDKCQVWYHYSCVGLTGHELFLGKRKSSWNCDKCKKLTRKRKR